MLFHRDVRHFASDFDLLRTIYLEGDTAYLFYSKSLRSRLEDKLPVGEILEIPARKNVLDRPIALRRVPQQDYRSFFEQLTETGIQYFTGIEDELLQLMVEEAAEDTDVDWVPSKAASGGALMQDIFDQERENRQNLFHFYKRLWDIGKRESDKPF